MRLRIFHRTTYRYTEPVRENVNELRLRPLDTLWQRCEASFITVFPATRLAHYEDLNCNTVHHFEIGHSHSLLQIESRSTVETKGKVDFANLPYGFQHADLKQVASLEECYPYLQDSHFVENNPGVWKLALDARDFSEDVFQTAYCIMEFIYEGFEYSKGKTTVATHANEVIKNRCGVCQDFAHVMVAMCRSLGMPARYVSGYFFDATRDHLLRGSEASHAWAEVYLQPHGWIGFDPTNNKVVDETYVVVATGRDYRDVAPIVGTYFGNGHSSMDVDVEVKCLKRHT